jgi:RNA polymerase sigma-70 factor (ECF subfamily)
MKSRNFRRPAEDAPMDPTNSQQEPCSEVSTLLRAWSDGDENALARLTPLVYQELRRLAHRQMKREWAQQTLQTTALVNEAYLRLVDAQQVRWQDRAHFFAISAKLMRRILIDYARRHNLKRGAGVQHVSLERVDAPAVGDPDLVALDEVLVALEKFDSRKAKVVEMRFFGGLGVDEVAEVLKVAPITVMREWNHAKAWLYNQLAKGAADGS